MKIITYLMMVLVLLTTGCQQRTPEEVAEIVGRAKINSVGKDVELRVQEMTKRLLIHPESYQSISTEMSVVTSNMILYDSKAFVALRDLNRALEDFHKEYGNDTTSQKVRDELEIMQAMAGVVYDRIVAVTERPVKFNAIDAYHQFYVNDNHNHKVKKGYHFVIHENNQITLLCDHDELLRVEAFAKRLFDYPPYKTNGNTIEHWLLSPEDNAVNEME